MPDDHRLPQDLNIYAATEWHERCLRWLAATDQDGAALRLDASAVAEADAAGVQLLTALANSLARRDRRLVLSQPSPALAKVCTLLGATFLLADATAAQEPTP